VYFHMYEFFSNISLSLILSMIVMVSLTRDFDGYVWVLAFGLTIFSFIFAIVFIVEQKKLTDEFKVYPILWTV